ncbi:hypothetical protein GCM10027168_55680 [Streptomyces capparidis]
MLVPLYEAVYARLDVGAGTRLLALRCGSGLALLMAAARGARVTGVEDDADWLALARERLLPGDRGGAAGSIPRVERHGAAPEERGEVLAELPGTAPGAPYTMVTVFDGLHALAEPERVLAGVARLAERGAPVVLAGWGPPERCRTGQVLRAAGRLAHPGARGGAVDPFRLSGPDDLEQVAKRAGLRPDGSGRVACPFAYPDLDSAVRGLTSTGLLDAAVEATDAARVEKELAEALRAFRLPDGGVRMDNVFRYTIARTP